MLQHSGAHAQRQELFPIAITYRSEIQPQMLQIVAVLQEVFGERAVVHGLSNINLIFDTCSIDDRFLQCANLGDFGQICTLSG